MNMQKACAGVAGKPGYTDCRLKAGSVQYRAKRGPSSLPGRPLPVSGVKYCTTLRMKSVQYCSLRYPMLCTPNLAHVAKRHRGARRVLGVHPSLGFRRTREHHLLFLVITVWFPYLRWLLLVILNLPAAIAVRAVLTIIYPATAGTMWTNLHCQHLLFQSSITEA